jgi:hypothetical protein
VELMPKAISGRALICLATIESVFAAKDLQIQNWLAKQGP